jgi:hypothetical protein
MNSNYGENRALCLNHNQNRLMSLAQTLYHWIDLFWIPVALLTMEKGKRLFTVGFILSCVLLLRLQVELMQHIGFPRGIFGVMESSIYARGLITYGAFITLFMLMAYYSKGVDKSIHIAASITMMIAALCVSALVMVL